ncbi:helix-turn-helix domain-containing protein [Microlunatus soli]|uniref:AraC-type DNA-binding protein n=1 Tax=Microlunatus soli TaxID=630515 RepID=A0A1H1TQ35_9ACTN|nr:helix-turn-helix transcriptional regulator [Microlunatus soli]SDS62171.1 AraC-type DNA-binding protein [Microlunatus soli]
MSEFRHQAIAPTRARPLPGGTTVDPHFHDQHQIVYAGRGVLSVQTDAGVWVAPTSRAIWIPAGTVHQHRAYGDTVLYTVGLPVDEEAAAGPGHAAGDTGIGAGVLGLSTPAVLEVGPLLRELLLSYVDGDPQESPARRRLRSVLLDQLQPATERSLQLPTPTDDRLLRAAAILAEQPELTSMRELARRCGCSDRTLSRLCRDQLAMTLPQWRTQIRLHRALRLLAEGETVTAVARATGWSTPSAFIDVFRRVLGSTPGRARPHSRANRTDGRAAG